jgi:hypothetical protein
MAPMEEGSKKRRQRRSYTDEFMARVLGPSPRLAQKVVHATLMADDL